MSGSFATIANLFGGEDILKTPLRSHMDMVALVSKGIPKPAVRAFITSFRGSSTRLSSSQIRNLVVKDATFRRCNYFKAATAERVIRLVSLKARAEDLLGSEAAANEFMLTPHILLKNKSPFEIANTETGARAVETLIERAACGLPV